MAVNLGKNRLTVLSAYQDVIDESCDTDWALFTYEEDSDALTLAASGGGGLPEITLTFDSSRVMYGFCSIKEPSAALPRYILINWVGDDVPDARKCACASHVATIAEFFQGVEVIVNASSVDDIEPSAVGQRLTNGTAAVASPVLSRLKTREEEHGDVGTVYQKTNAEVEMKKINREEFWEQAKKEEELRKEEERKKAAEERQRYEEERMELERQEQENREKRYRERERQIEEHRSENHFRIPPQGLISECDMTLKQHKAKLWLFLCSSLVQEAKAIIAQRSGNPREFFKQKERALTVSVDTSPVSVHRAAHVAVRGPIPVRTVGALQWTHHPRNIKAGFLCSADLSPKPEHEAAAQEATPSKPVHSVAPRGRDSAWDSGTDKPVDLWDSSSAPPTNSLIGDANDVLRSSALNAASATAPGGRPQPLLSFDDTVDGSFCSSGGAEDEPSSLVDVTGSDHMTLSYQHALQHAAGEGAELEDGDQLMTNGETFLKEGLQASEGYFSQSQEEEFGQSEDSSTKPAPVLYNKPPEIDITCWDTDPVVDDEDD
uniref:Drebrin n=1 Tax=Cynoglossus semilaevis TaxID=244447 RepID=A0A3P8WZK7_CYNSE